MGASTAVGILLVAGPEVAPAALLPDHRHLVRRADRRLPFRLGLLGRLASSGLQLPKKRLYLRALDLYTAHPFLDFGDALAAAHIQGQGLTEILSYDSDFERLPGVQRIEP
ncbi:MAG: PIN domain-containing protein [Chloroflexi bacterium]|nr:PIN domain-containing protein [Chloroflexota bacterium]